MVVFRPDCLVNHRINAYKVLLCLLNGYTIEDIEVMVYNHNYSRLINDLIDLEKNGVFSKIEYDRWKIGNSNFRYEISDKIELLEVGSINIYDFLKYKDVYNLMIDLSFMFNNKPRFNYNSMIKKHLINRSRLRGDVGVRLIEKEKTYIQNKKLVTRTFYDKIEIYKLGFS